MVAEMDLPMETIADLNEVCRYAFNWEDYTTSSVKEDASCPFKMLLLVY